MAKIKVFSPANEEKLQIEFDKDMIIVRKELSEIEKRTKKSRSDKEKLLIASKRKSTMYRVEDMKKRKEKAEITGIIPIKGVL